MRNLHVLLIGLIIVLSTGCKTYSVESSSKGINIIDEYTSRLKKSLEFLYEKRQLNFTDSLYLYMRNLKASGVYNFYDGKIPPIVCQPILINKEKDKALVFILTRSLDLGNNDVEIISMISARYNNAHWKFDFNVVQDYTFSYVNNYPPVSDTEIGIRVLRNIYLEGFLKQGNDDNEIFSSYLYVFK